MSQTRDFPELGFYVVATVFEYHVDFVIYDVMGRDPATNAPSFPRKGATNHPDLVETIEESEPYLTGGVKWDGCSNWHFDEQDRCMLHGCERKDLTRFGEVMAQCWDWTRELLRTFNP